MADRPVERAAVLMFHGLTPGETDAAVPVRERKYWVGERQFESQLREISHAGYEVRSLHDFWSGAAAGAPATVITFDDGAESDYALAFPRLLAAGATATFFLNTNNVGKPGYITWTQAREMLRYGMSFGSHGHDHVYLTSLAPAEVREQMQLSKQLLEERLGCPADFFSIPYGDCNRQILWESQRAGYRASCTSRSLRARPGRLTVNRVAVYSDSGPDTIRRMITGSRWFYTARVARAAFFHLPKQIILTKELAA